MQENRLRISEGVIAAYFLWTSVLALTLPIAVHLRTRTLAANIAVGACYLLLLSLRRAAWAGYVRDWLPQALMILAYKEQGWFAPPSHDYSLERQWIVWDRILLDEWGFRALVESAGKLLPSLLEISYSLVYALPPITMGVLYAAGERRKSDTLLTVYLLGLFLSYAQFPFWPSEPPRTVFAGQDLPRISTVFREFNLWLVGGYGIHTSVFPSAHVSGAFAAVCAIAYLMPRRRMLIAAYLAYALAVASATVYGRYHYAVDALAGMAVGVAALPLALGLLSLRRYVQ